VVTRSTIAILSFPADRAVGTLDWAGSHTTLEEALEAARDRGLVLAQGSVEVPADARGVAFNLCPVSHVESQGDGWAIESSGEPLDLGFLTALPPTAIESLELPRSNQVIPSTLSALPHLAPGLKRLYAGFGEYGDDLLAHVSELVHLTYLQTWGNHFTDSGVQVLESLDELETLYLEEEELTPKAFQFAHRLSRLTRIGVADEWPSGYRDALRQEFPGLVR
jgi:hypothetical protein